MSALDGVQVLYRVRFDPREKAGMDRIMELLYSTKSRLPQWGILVRLYLAVPLLWRFFGKQALVVAEKRSR